MNKPNTIEQSQTDWAKLDAMSDEDIDYSDIPPITDEMFKNPIIRKNFKVITKNAQENLPIDRDIIEYFKTNGENYQAQINRVLRAFMEAHRAK